MVTLNRTVALSHGGPAENALELLDTDAPSLDGYQPFFAAKADFLKRLGRYDAAQEAYQAALDITTNDAEKDFLNRQLAEIGTQT